MFCLLKLREVICAQSMRIVASKRNATPIGAMTALLNILILKYKSRKTPIKKNRKYIKYECAKILWMLYFGI